MVLAGCPVASESLFCRAAGRRSQSNLFVLRFEGRDEFFQASSLSGSRSTGQDTDGMGQRHLDGGLLFFRKAFGGK